MGCIIYSIFFNYVIEMLLQLSLSIIIMKFITAIGLLLGFAYQGLQATIAPPPSTDNVLGNGDFSDPYFVESFNQMQSQLIPFWTDRTSKQIILVNANFFNKKWPKNNQALKLTSQTQVSQQFNAEINSTYRLSLKCSFAYNTTIILEPIPPYIGVKILINDQTIRQVIPSSGSIQQIDVTFVGQHILNIVQLIGFTIDEKNCDLNSFVLVGNISIVEIMDAVHVKGYEQIYALASGIANVWHSPPVIENRSPQMNYRLDTQLPNGLGRISFQYPHTNLFFAFATPEKSKWKGIIIQGGYQRNQWITSFRLFSTSNGRDWAGIQNNKIYNANWDRDSRVRIDFPQIVQATSIKLVILTWNEWPALRIEAICIRQLK